MKTNFSNATAPVVILFSLVLFGCVGLGEEQFSRPLDRRDLLVERVELRLAQENRQEAIDHIGAGLEQGLVTSRWARETLEAVARAFRTDFDEALIGRDFPAALQARWNLSQLAKDPLQVELIVDMEGVPSRDDLLLRWAEEDLEEERPVLAMHRLLRRSTLADLDQEQMHRFFSVAQSLNNDEIARRLSLNMNRNASGESEIPEVIVPAERSPSEMLSGTVTVWVNRGMKISDGVGVPDRVIGSGFFVDPRGYILTNYHIISSEVDPTYNGFSRLHVKLSGRPNERIPARVIGYDRVFDLALIKVEVDAPYVFSLSDTRRLSPGERVLALGSPGGLDSTITSGIVSASGRRFLQMGDAVQIDAPINPGNSGGPLVLPDGQVAGIVFAGIPQFDGVSFAIPAYWVRHFFPRLFDGEEVDHPWIGVAVHAGRQGLRVVYVHPDSPAHRSGVQVGDLLRKINGRAVEDLAGAQDILMKHRAGDLLITDWEIAEQGEDVRRFTGVSKRPFSPVEDALKTRSIESLFPVLYGMRVDEISGRFLGPDYVITDVYPGSVADESSLSPSDPFSLRNWRVDEELRAAFIQIIIRKRKAGFLESGLQLGAFLETDSFL